MAMINEQQLKNQIKSGDKRVYILLGNDGYLKKLYAKKIGETCALEDDIFNYQKFTFQNDLQEVYDAVLQFPMMSDKKFVCLTDFDFEKCDKTDYEKLCTLISDTPDTCIFVLFFDALEVTYKKNKKFEKLVSLAEKNNGAAVLLDHRTTPELIKMLTNGAQKRGCKFDSAAAKYLIESVGEDIDTLKNELEKLCYFVNGKDITKEIIDKVSYKSVESSIYSLSKQILACDMPSAMKTIDELFYLRIEPIVILSTISSFYVDMYRAFLGKEKGVNISGVVEAFGYYGREFVVRNALSDSKKLDLNKFSLSFKVLHNADDSLKSFSCNPRTVLEQTAVKLGYIALKGEAID